MESSILLWASFGASLLALLACLWLVFRPASGQQEAAAQEKRLLDELARLRSEIADNSRQQRAEVGERFAGFIQELRAGREESTKVLGNFVGGLGQQLSALTDSNAQRMHEMRTTIEQRLQALQNDNSAKLEEMRRTVDEKLHATLEQRLGESFKLVSERLEQVHRGLGEMQNLASGVGDLKRVLSNVKSRGIFGEIQLAVLLEQVFNPEQYSANVATKPNSNERVEFAIRLPGQDEKTPVWLPIDAKFPREDYERLLDAQERADRPAADAAANALEARIRAEAKAIATKYLAPPHTTDFAILFLPIESLYAEVLRRPGLMEALQREHRVTVTGPTNLLAFLNSLQMGFRTLTIEKRSSEVWQVLGAVKNEFGKFGEVLDKVKKKLEEATSQIEQTNVRSRAITRQLRDVQELPGTEAQRVLESRPGEDS